MFVGDYLFVCSSRCKRLQLQLTSIYLLIIAKDNGKCPPMFQEHKVLELFIQGIQLTLM